MIICTNYARTMSTTSEHKTSIVLLKSCMFEVLVVVVVTATADDFDTTYTLVEAVAIDITAQWFVVLQNSKIILTY